MRHALLTNFAREGSTSSSRCLCRLFTTVSGWTWVTASIDVLVEDCVILELKACDAIAPIHEAQLLSYLKLSDKHVGLLINFHVLRLKDGIKRYVMGKSRL